jgi:hypothetical protein
VLCWFFVVLCCILFCFVALCCVLLCCAVLFCFVLLCCAACIKAATCLYVSTITTYLKSDRTYVMYSLTTLPQVQKVNGVGRVGIELEAVVAYFQFLVRTE